MRVIDIIGGIAYTAAMRYPGGKNGAGVYQKIINQIPPHRVYVEAFLGSGAVLRKKKPARVNIAIDRDESIIANCAVRISSESFIGICADAISWLRDYDWKGDEFVYCDPPYLAETRRGRHRRIYPCEMMTREEHAELLKVLTRIPAMVMISGYWSELYVEQLANWRVVDFEAITRWGKLATEYLWMNYPKPTQLHDYNYLGQDARRRQDLRRMKERWKKKIQSMDQVKRQAIVSAILEICQNKVERE